VGDLLAQTITRNAAKKAGQDKSAAGDAKKKSSRK
jgi:hypothetical protein